MKVIGITGSPRKNSNTEYLVQFTLDKIESHGISTELVRIREQKIQPCQACYNCVVEKKCAIKDDFENVYDKMVRADGILLGSPTYHGSITPNIKALLDRAGFLSRWQTNKIEPVFKFKGTAFSGKVGAPITVARRAGFISALSDLLLWLSVNDITIATSGYWTHGLAVRNPEVAADITVDQDKEGLFTLEHLADNMAFLIKKINECNTDEN